MIAVAHLRLASWRWLIAGALVFTSVLAAALALRSAPAMEAPVSAAQPAQAAAEVDPLTPAVAEIAWRDPQQRIEVIARFKPGVSPADATRLVHAHGGSVIGEIGLINGIAAELRAADAAQLARRDGVFAVSLNARVENHDLEIQPKALLTSFNHSVRSPKVWYQDRFEYTGKGVGVAVVDTGIQGDLPDFRVSKSDPTSRVAVSVTTHPNPGGHGDGYGHGTHVAGLIAGNSEPRNDGLAGRYAGVAPEADLISVKVSDNDGDATLLDVIYGLQFVVEHKDQYGIRIVNLSLNSTVAESYKTDPLNAAVEEAWFAGIVVVAAAGNRGADADAVQYAPANDPYVISIGAVDDKGTKDTNDDALTEWSSRGQTQDGFTKPDLLAPGAHIVSTLAPGSDIESLCPSCVRPGGYFQMGGTSMSAAVASGVAALILEAHPEYTPDQVKGSMENRLRNVPGVGGEAAADKAVSAPPRKTVANQGLTPNELINPATGRIDWDRARWSRARWSAEVDDSRARWSRARWSLSPETIAEGQVEHSATDPSRARWSRARWSRARWSMSFSK